MKKIFSIFAAILFTGSMFAAVEDFTVTITKDAFNKTSYAANNNEKTSLATAVADPSRTLNVKWTTNQMMLKSDGSCVQSQKTNGALYNAASWGKIKSVTISGGTNLAYTIGATAQPTTSADGGFFQIKNNSTGTGYFDEITIVFEADAAQAVLNAADVELGEVICEGGVFQREENIEIEAANLTQDITFSSTSSKISFPSLTALPKEGGQLLIMVTANAGDELNEAVVLESGDIKHTLYVKGKVFEKFRNPGTAAEFEAGAKALGGDSTFVNGDKAVKVGTSSDPGTAFIYVPVNAKKLYFLAAAWANKPCTMTLSATGVTLSEESFDLTADAGIAGAGSVYTTAKGDLAAYQCVVDLSDVTAGAKITATATGSNKRFVIWDVTYEAGSTTAIDNTADENQAVKTIKNGQLIIEKNGVRYNVMGQVIR